jgi:tetratricopeptide (TPR) repeat protein
MRIRSTYLVILLILLQIQSTLAANKKELLDSLLHWSSRPDSEQKIDKLTDFSFQLIFYDMGNAALYAEKALALSRQIGYNEGMMHAHNNLSLIFINQIEYKKGISHAYQSLEKAWELKDYDFVAYQNVQLALIYKYIGAYQDAIRFYQNAIELEDSIKDFKPLFFAKRGVGLTYGEMQDYTASNRIFKELILLCEEHNDEIKKGILLNDIGRNYLLNGDYDLAIESFHRSLQIKKEQNDPRIRMALRDLGETFAALELYDSAFQYLGASLKVCNDQNYSFGSMSTHFQLAKTYLLVNSYDSALKHTETALSYARQLNLLDHIRDHYKQLAEIYQEKGDQDRAFHMLESYIHLNDSLNLVKKKNSIEAYMLLEDKEKELGTQKANLDLLAKKQEAETRYRWALFGLVIFLVSILMLLYQRYKIRLHSEKILAQKNQEIANKNREISEMNKLLQNRLFRLQMDPHFIFNSLSAIQHFITANDQDSALIYLTRFSKLIRQILDNSVHDKVPLVEELKILNHYLELESLRFNHSFSYEIRIIPGADIYNIEVPFLLIQPYVENAINHGLKGVKNGKLIILVSCTGDTVRFAIEDNGIGREKAAVLRKEKNNHRSLGMSINHHRINNMLQKHPETASVQVTDLMNEHRKSYGTRVEIKVPLDF